MTRIWKIIADMRKRDDNGETKVEVVSYQCCVCGQVGPREAMVEVNGLRTVHRWPCRDLMVDG